MSEQNRRSDQFWKTLSFTTVCLKCWPEETGWFCKTFSWESRKQTVNCSKIQIFKSEVWETIFGPVWWMMSHFRTLSPTSVEKQWLAFIWNTLTIQGLTIQITRQEKKKRILERLNFDARPGAAEKSNVCICGEWAVLIGHKAPLREVIGLKAGMLSPVVVKQPSSISG